MKLDTGQAGSRKATDGRSFLARLARDVRGNTLAIMAMALIPLSAMAGSAIDTARLYVVKARLQQACDAGVLAGRKFMEDSDSTTLDDTASTRARTFFNNNFSNGWMGSHDTQFTPTKTTDKQVAGTAQTTVPMTVMKMFRASDTTLSVACEARFDVADTDIVFVLDTTGSMACPPEMSDSDCNTFSGNQTKVAYQRPSDSGGVPGYAGSTTYYVTESTSGGKNNSRIQAVRDAVTDFYSTMSSNIDPSTHVRYGFVTYSSMVNPGQAILDKSAGYMLGGAGGGGATSWTYQSRSVDGEYQVSRGSVSWNNRTQTTCGSGYPQNRSPAAALTFNTSAGTATQTNESWLKNGSVSQCGSYTQTIGPVWKYQPVSYDVAGFVAGNTVTTPAQWFGASSKWMGCIEEASTTAGATSFSTLPNDLRPDLRPTTDAERWKPLWPEVEYLRSSATTYPTTNGDSSSNPNYVDPTRLQLGKMACGKPIKRLSEMSAADVSKFVTASDFRALGGTYHDIGMIWGLRLLWPTGIFAGDTTAWTGRPAPKRVLIFLTDGDMAPSTDAYSVYGVEQLDKRVTGGDLNNRITYHNARFAALCDRAKGQEGKIDIWTVSIAPSATPELTACASNSAQALYSTTGKGLSDAFKKIAKQVAMLRMSK